MKPESLFKGEALKFFCKRILPRISLQGTCWIWIGSLNRKGYGSIRIGGRNGASKPVHRVVYELYFGPMPKGLVSDHLCRKRPCCNPLHIEPVTARTNTLRGIGQGVLNSRKRFCPKGHEYTKQNTRITYGRRRCRVCLRAAKRIYKCKMKARQ